MRLGVGVTYPESPGLPNELLLDTGTRNYALKIEHDAKVMRITEVIVPGGPHENDIQSFSLRFTIDDTNVACFFINQLPVHGERFYMTTKGLLDCLRAVGPGTTTLRIQAILMPSPLEIDFDELEASDVLEVRISVPPPLEAKLISYSDRFYGGPGSPAVVASLGSIDAFDVICDHGKLTGKVEHHNPNSTSECITFSLDTPEGLRPNVDLIGLYAFTNATDFATFVEGLALAGADGTNLITVEAWKPINQLVSQGPSR